jgi:hypothetical protein
MGGYPAVMRHGGDDLNRLQIPAAERDRLIYKMRRKGWTYAKISKHTGMSISGVRSSLVRMAQGRCGSRDAVAKLRLDGTPTPRSLGGSDDEAASTNRCGQERLLCGGPSKGRAMTENSNSNDDHGAARSP